MIACVEHDRGLGTAYERYCFYQLVDRWASELGVESALEGPVDGMAGVPGVHCVGLARRGVPVVSAVLSDAQARVTRAIYERAGARGAGVRVVSAAHASELPKADLVIAYHALSLVDDWRSYLATMAKLARRALVVTTVNPRNWGVATVRWVGRVRRAAGFETPAEWGTDVLAPELWSLGRVREHTYFDCPWWPDLLVSAGQSLTSRAGQLLFAKKADAPLTDVEKKAALAAKYVYGAERWPYFGGEGWHEELLPALLTHPTFEGARTSIRARAAHLHAFVVDVRPRTPQARRRLETAR